MWIFTNFLEAFLDEYFVPIAFGVILKTRQQSGLLSYYIWPIDFLLKSSHISTFNPFLPFQTAPLLQISPGRNITEANLVQQRNFTTLWPIVRDSAISSKYLAQGYLSKILLLCPSFRKIFPFNKWRPFWIFKIPAILSHPATLPWKTGNWQTDLSTNYNLFKSLQNNFQSLQPVQQTCNQ